MYQFTGTLTKIKATEQVTEKFKKRNFVVTDESGQYPNPILLQLTQDKCTLLDMFKEGEEVDVKFFLRGNTKAGDEENGEEKNFVNLEAYSIKRTES